MEKFIKYRKSISCNINISIETIHGHYPINENGLWYRPTAITFAAVKANAIMKSVPANAILNLKEEPATLYVHGSVMTFNHNSTLTFHASLGSDDPNTLILEIQVSSGTHPTAAHPQSYLYASSAPEVRSYKRVLITPPNLEPVTVDVQVFR